MSPVPGNQVNVEYFFRLVYDCFVATCRAGGNWGWLTAFLAHLWVWITVLGYLIAFAGLALIAYCMVRLFALRQAEEERYGSILVAPETGPANPRWAHIESLASGDNPSEWREAIIEADIMLGDLLTRQGYSAETIGEQLKLVERSDMATLDQAFAAHGIRNRIAHDGSAFDLSKVLAQRTIGQYASVFREFDLI